MARKSYAKHLTIITNTTPTNKARSTGIILHKNWEIVKEQKHESGTDRSRSQNCEYLDVRVMCAYLPTALDAYGMPESFDSTKESKTTMAQEEAYAIYSTASEWAKPHKYWIS